MIKPEVIPIEKRIKQFRKRWGQTEGFVVVSPSNTIGGHMKNLDYTDWFPGSIAVDKDNNKWIAVGGDNQNGAERWEKI